VALAVQTLVTTAPRRRIEQPVEDQLGITVLFTSVELTINALKTAGELASRLNAQIMLLVPQVVPYPLPLSSPPVLVEFNERRFSVIAELSRVATHVQVYLCRDRWIALESVLAPHSLIVVGVRNRWWPTRDMRLAAKLRRAGHEVVLATTE